MRKVRLDVTLPDEVEVVEKLQKAAADISQDIAQEQTAATEPVAPESVAPATPSPEAKPTEPLMVAGMSLPEGLTFEDVAAFFMLRYLRDSRKDDE